MAPKLILYVVPHAYITTVIWGYCAAAADSGADEVTVAVSYCEVIKLKKINAAGLPVVKMNCVKRTD